MFSVTTGLNTDRGRTYGLTPGHAEAAATAAATGSGRVAGPVVPVPFAPSTHLRLRAWLGSLRDRTVPRAVSGNSRQNPRCL